MPAVDPAGAGSWSGSRTLSRGTLPLSPAARLSDGAVSRHRRKPQRGRAAIRSFNGARGVEPLDRLSVPGRPGFSLLSSDFLDIARCVVECELDRNVERISMQYDAIIIGTGQAGPALAS